MTRPLNVRYVVAVAPYRSADATLFESSAQVDAYITKLVKEGKKPLVACGTGTKAELCKSLRTRKIA